MTRKVRGVAKRAQIGIRLPEELRLRLAAAAKANQVSLNALITERLDKSFDIHESFGGLRLFNHMLMLSRLIVAVETQHGKSWMDDRAACDDAAEAAAAFFAVLGPSTAGEKFPQDQTFDVLLLKAVVESFRKEHKK